mmetsp:Transcript_27581/g.81667  ORF Transcript_27581/g.81667 Transcript_27581/m.81667 type:complete len:251 (-) Transcript_27581:40-792(-)
MSWGAPAAAQRSKSDGAALSKQTQALLDDVMSKRGLSLRAMQDVSESIKSGSGSWADTLNRTTASFHEAGSKSLSRTAGVRVPKFSGRGGGGPPPAPQLPGSFSGKRMLPGILRAAPPERDQFRGCAPGPSRDAEKDRLSEVMEHGRKGVADRQASMQEAAAARRAAAARAAAADPQEDLVNQLVDEIQERREFLEDMQAAGRGAEYDAKIRGEIAQRMRDLERLGVDVASSRPAARPPMQGPLVWTHPQ